MLKNKEGEKRGKFGPGISTLIRIRPKRRPMMMRTQDSGTLLDIQEKDWKASLAKTEINMKIVRR